MFEIVRDLAIVAMLIAIANIVFNNFEKHLSALRRLLKHGTAFLIISGIRIFLGQAVFIGVLSLITLGQVYLHALWLSKQGINGITALPYEKYLKVIKRQKEK